MMRIAPIELDAATGKAKDLLDEVTSRGGEPGPMVRAMANAPAVLRGYLDLSRAVKRTHLNRRITERISLAVHEWPGCEYCLAAHARVARELGLGKTEIALARQGTSAEPTIAAIVAFGQQVVAAPSEVSDGQVAGSREHGYSDEQIGVVALVALQLLTGAFNLVAGLEPAASETVASERSAA